MIMIKILIIIAAVCFLAAFLLILRTLSKHRDKNDKVYIQEFIEKIKRGEQQIKEGKVTKIEPKNIWKSIEKDVDKEFIKLERSDLLKRYRDIPISKIDVDHFKKSSLSLDMLHNALFIIFIDGIDYKILKDRCV